MQHETRYQSEGCGDERSEIHQRLGDERQEDINASGENQDATGGQVGCLERDRGDSRKTAADGGGARPTGGDKRDTPG